MGCGNCEKTCVDEKFLRKCDEASHHSISTKLPSSLFFPLPSAHQFDFLQIISSISTLHVIKITQHNIRSVPSRSMHQEYLNLFIKFYQKTVEQSKQAQLLKRTLQRFLNYEYKEQQKMIKQRQKEGSDYKSFKSGSSNTSINSFDKVKKLFYSNHIETSILFYYFLNRIKAKDASAIVKLLAKAGEKVKMLEKGLAQDEKRRYNAKINKLIEYIQYLQTKVAEERPIDWIYFEVFKEFQSEAVLTAQVLSSQGSSLQSKESIKQSDYSEFLKVLKTECYIFDYINRQIQLLGVQGEKVYIGRRSDTYFVLTQKQFQKANSSKSGRQIISLSRKQLTSEKQLQQKQSKIKDLKKYSTNKFKQQFLSQMLKLRQGYESNTATIAHLFNFKDANESSKIADETNQA